MAKIKQANSLIFIVIFLIRKDQEKEGRITHGEKKKTN